MKMNSIRCVVFSAAVSSVLAGFPALCEESGGFSQAFVERVHERLEPAICLVSYSAEVTNPRTGEVKKGNTRALGLLVSPDGLVLTHGHMQIENKEPFSIQVTVGRGDEEQDYEAVLLEKPEDVNVCLLRIESDEPLDLPYAEFAEEGKLALGEPLLLLGILGETFDFEPCMFVRRVGSVLETPRTTYCVDDRVPFGVVGAPVVNSIGQVTGVVGFDLNPQEGGELYIRHGHPLVFPAELFMDAVRNPAAEHERAAEDDGTGDAWLGVLTQPLTDDLAEYWGLRKKGGIVISAVVPNSPAAQAGLERGDVLTSFAGTPLRMKQDREVLSFTKLVRDTGAGVEAEVKLIREGEPMELTVGLEARPKSARDATEYEDELFGLTVREITTDLRMLLNLSEDVKGVIVRRVKSGGWADLAGFRAGVIILSFGGHAVEGIAGYQQAVATVAEEEPSEVTVFCRVGPRTGFFRIQPRWEDANTE